MARIVFMGTPQFGVPVLEALVQHHEVVAVVTQPDRIAGRGQSRVQMPPVKALALAHGLRMLQPARLRRDRETVAALRELDADLFCIAAYGQILPHNVLDIPRHGCIGVHASLLPRLRGAAPIAAAILNGDAETGISLMLTDRGMDTGDVIAQASLPIAPDDTTESLSAQMARLGADLLIETIPPWLAGEIAPTPQDDALATYAPMISKDDGAIDWTLSAIEIDRRIRAYTPWPGSFCTCHGDRMKVLTAHPRPDWDGGLEPGTVICEGKTIGVATGQGLLVVDRLQPAGKRPMDAYQFSCGRREFVSSTLV